MRKSRKDDGRGRRGTKSGKHEPDSYSLGQRWQKRLATVRRQVFNVFCSVITPRARTSSLSSAFLYLNFFFQGHSFIYLFSLFISAFFPRRKFPVTLIHFLKINCLLPSRRFVILQSFFFLAGLEWSLIFRFTGRSKQSSKKKKTKKISNPHFL